MIQKTRSKTAASKKVRSRSSRTAPKASAPRSKPHSLSRGKASAKTAVLEAAALDLLSYREPVDEVPEAENVRARYAPNYLKARRVFEEAFREIGHLAAPIEPPAGLKARLFARVAADTEKRETPTAADANALEGSQVLLPGVVAVRSAEARWTAASIVGVEFKLLGRDAERGITTKLIRLAPGFNYPSHRHGGVEEVFVLEGSVKVNGVLLRAGDYCRSESGTEEHGTSTVEGATAIVISSDDDSFVDPPASVLAKTIPVRETDKGTRTT